MIEQILMGASAVITLSACYVGWRFAKDAEGYYKALDLCREERDEYKAGVDHWIAESDRMAEVIGKHQDKAHKCDKCNQFASKRKAKTAELQAYVASKKAVS